MTLTFNTMEEIDVYYSEDFGYYNFVDEYNKVCDIEILFNFTTTRDIVAKTIKAMSLFAGNIDVTTLIASNVAAKDIEAKAILARNIVANDIKGWCTITAHNIKANDIIATEVNCHGDIICYGDIIANDITAWGHIRANHINYVGICGAYSDIICQTINGRKQNSMQFSLDGDIIVGDDILTYTSKIIELNSIEDMESYYNNKTNTYEFVKRIPVEDIEENGNRNIGLNIQFNFDLDVKSDIRAGSIKGKKISCYMLSANDISAENISAGRIYATDINCRDISTNSVEANYIKCRNVHVSEHIDVNSIDAIEMVATDIKAYDSITCRDIEFVNVCYAHNNIVCENITGLESYSKYFVLNGEIKIKDGR